MRRLDNLEMTFKPYRLGHRSSALKIRSLEVVLEKASARPLAGGLKAMWRLACDGLLEVTWFLC